MPRRVGKPKSKTPHNLSVLTYNVGSRNYNNDKDICQASMIAVNTMVREQKVDLVCLQEVSSLRTTMLPLFQSELKVPYGFVSTMQFNSKTGNPVVSKPNEGELTDEKYLPSGLITPMLTSDQCVTFYNPKRLRPNKILPYLIGLMTQLDYAKNYVQTKNFRKFVINFFNNNLCVINVHAEHTYNSKNYTGGRAHEIFDVINHHINFIWNKEITDTETGAVINIGETILTRLKTYKIILVGDMNSSMDKTDWEYFQVSDHIKELVNIGTSYWGCATTTETHQTDIEPKTTSDWIISSLPLRRGSYKTVRFDRKTNELSDHTPVMANFEYK